MQVNLHDARPALGVDVAERCELTQAGKVVTRSGVKIVGHLNVPGRLASDTSALYARNLLNFVQLMIDKESKALKIDWEDELIKGTCVTRDGNIVHPDLAGAKVPESKPAASEAASQGEGG